MTTLDSFLDIVNHPFIIRYPGFHSPIKKECRIGSIAVLQWCTLPGYAMSAVPIVTCYCIADISCPAHVTQNTDHTCLSFIVMYWISAFGFTHLLTFPWLAMKTVVIDVCRCIDIDVESFSTHMHVHTHT